MAVVYENVWLKEQASREQKIKHEVLARFDEQQINLVKECPACGACYDSAVETCAKDQRALTLKAREKIRRQIKVLDFGLAKILQVDPANPQSLTTPGTIMGTFAYMSPEQVTGEEVDERSDIFSLGVMAVEALTGHRPFLGRTSAELIAAIMSAPYHLPGVVGEKPGEKQGKKLRELRARWRECGSWTKCCKDVSRKIGDNGSPRWQPCSKS